MRLDNSIPRALCRPGGVAVLILVFLIARPCLWGATPSLISPSKTVMEVTGGTGAKSWTIRYGTNETFRKYLVAGEGNNAWLSHGGWLRQIDTEKGVVVGRWHFPGSIVHLEGAGQGVQIQLEEKESNRVFTRLISFDPSRDKTIAFWPSGNLALNRVPFFEVEAMWGNPVKVGVLSQDFKLTAEVDAKGVQNSLEELLRRDPMDPAVRVALWRVLRQAKDPRASTLLDEALAIPSTDYTEMLPIASLLEFLDEPEAARRAFETGYKNYLDRGNDPRLNMGLIGKIILYPSQHSKPPDFSTDHGRELMERHYRLAPYSESADLAWLVFADISDKQGRADDAKKWRERSQEASFTSIFLTSRKVGLLSDIILLIISASLLSAVLLLIFMSIRYRPQRCAEAAAQQSRGALSKLLAVPSFRHWTVGQRVSFLMIALAAWISTGVEAGIITGIGRVAATPLSLAMGSLASPVSKDYLENRVLASPERDLVLAVSNQQAGRIEEAEKLYRSRPEFPESWNNLGVILRAKGNESEAKQAFEKAQQLDPNLGEAAVNLGQPPRGIWAEQFAKYFPGRPMLAPPSPERVATALFGGSMKETVLRGLAGPFAGNAFGLFFSISGTGAADAPAAILFTGLVIGVLVLAVVLLFVSRRAVTEPPPRSFLIAEVLFPGIAEGWGILGGTALVAWAFFLQQLFLIHQVGSPYILMSIAQPNVGRAYGFSGVESASLQHALTPSWTWTYAAPLALFLVNLGVLALSRRSEGGTAAKSS